MLEDHQNNIPQDNIMMPARIVAHVNIKKMLWLALVIGVLIIIGFLLPPLLPFCEKMPKGIVNFHEGFKAES